MHSVWHTRLPYTQFLIKYLSLFLLLIWKPSEIVMYVESRCVCALPLSLDAEQSGELQFIARQKTLQDRAILPQKAACMEKPRIWRHPWGLMPSIDQSESSPLLSCNDLPTSPSKLKSTVYFSRSRAPQLSEVSYQDDTASISRISRSCVC